MKLAEKIINLYECGSPIVAEAEVLSFANLNPSTYKEFEDVLAKVVHKKSPSGMSHAMVGLKSIFRNLNAGKDVMFNKDSYDRLASKNIENTIHALGVEKLDACLNKLLNVSNEPIKTKHATFINSSTLSDASFKAKVKELDNFLSSLKAPHSKAIRNDCVVRFVRKEECKASAKYKQEKSEIYLRPDRRIVAGDNYGSFVYVLLHEMGHRYEQKNNTSQFEEPAWSTTKYSMKDTFAGGERFAELFAMSHWPEKYPEHKAKIEKFLSIIGNG